MNGEDEVRNTNFYEFTNLICKLENVNTLKAGVIDEEIASVIPPWQIQY